MKFKIKSLLVLLAVLPLVGCDDDDDKQKEEETPACSENAMKCEENSVMKCVEGDWKLEEACGDTKTCKDNACHLNETTEKCEENKMTCDGNTVNKCVGGQWKSWDSCSQFQTCKVDQCVSIFDCTGKEDGNQCGSIDKVEWGYACKDGKVVEDELSNKAPSACSDTLPYCVSDRLNPSCVECTKDDHCKDGKVCKYNECVAPADPNDPFYCDPAKGNYSRCTEKDGKVYVLTCSNGEKSGEPQDCAAGEMGAVCLDQTTYAICGCNSNDDCANVAGKPICGDAKTCVAGTLPDPATIVSFVPAKTCESIKEKSVGVTSCESPADKKFNLVFESGAELTYESPTLLDGGMSLTTAAGSIVISKLPGGSKVETTWHTGAPEDNKLLVDDGVKAAQEYTAAEKSTQETVSFDMSATATSVTIKHGATGEKPISVRKVEVKK